MLGYGQFTLETGCEYGYSLKWTFPSPGWPQAVENSLSELPLELLMASLGCVTSAHWVPCDTHLCHSGFGHLSSSSNSSWWRAGEVTNLFWTAFACCLGLTDLVQQLTPNLNPLQAFWGTPAPVWLTRDSKPPAWFLSCEDPGGLPLS